MGHNGLQPPKTSKKFREANVSADWMANKDRPSLSEFLTVSDISPEISVLLDANITGAYVQIAGVM